MPFFCAFIEELSFFWCSFFVQVQQPLGTQPKVSSLSHMLKREVRAKINKPTLPSQVGFVPCLNKAKPQKSKLSDSAVTLYIFVNFFSAVATLIIPGVTGLSQSCLHRDVSDGVQRAVASSDTRETWVPWACGWAKRSTSDGTATPDTARKAQYDQAWQHLPTFGQ